MRRARKVVGGLAVSLGLLLVVAGAAVAAYVGPDNTVRSDPARITTDAAAAVISNELFKYVGPNVRIEIAGHDGAEVFAGVGHAEDVADFLGETQYSQVRVTALPFTPRLEAKEGRAGPLPAPISSDLWVASIQGTGSQELVWPSTDGDWRVVLMRADGTEGVDAAVEVGFEMPQLFLGALTAMISGLAGLVGGFLLLRRRRSGGAELPEQRSFGAESWHPPAAQDPDPDPSRVRDRAQARRPTGEW